MTGDPSYPFFFLLLRLPLPLLTKKKKKIKILVVTLSMYRQQILGCFGGHRVQETCLKQETFLFLLLFERMISTEPSDSNIIFCYITSNLQFAVASAPKN